MDTVIRNTKTGELRTFVGTISPGPDEEFESTWLWGKVREALSGLPVRVRQMYPAEGVHNWKVVLDVAEGQELPSMGQEFNPYFTVKVSLNHEKIMGLLAEATGLVPVISRGSTFLDYPSEGDDWPRLGTAERSANEVREDERSKLLPDPRLP